MMPFMQGTWSAQAHSNSGMVGFRGWREQGSCLQGQSGSWEHRKVLGNVPVPQSCTLKMVKMINFMVCILTTTTQNCANKEWGMYPPLLLQTTDQQVQSENQLGSTYQETVKCRQITMEQFQNSINAFKNIANISC